MRARGGKTVIGGVARRAGGGLIGVAALAALAGCSSIPDSLDPGPWVSGASDWVSGVFGGSSSEDNQDNRAAQPSQQAEPTPDHETGQTPLAPAEKPQLGNDERPKGQPTAERQQIAEGLVGDRSNAQYAEAEAKREGEATRPLNESASAPPADQTAAPAAEATPPAPAPAPQKSLSSSMPAAPAPASPAAQASAAAETPPPVPAPSTETDAVVAPSARVQMNEGQGVPTAPAEAKPTPAPAPVATSAPAPAPAPAQAQAVTPAPAPAPVASRPSAPLASGDLVASTYRQRLAEFNEVSAASGAGSRVAYAAPAPSAAESAVMNESGAMPNSKVTAAHGSGGAHPLSALDQSKVAASFQVAQIVFGEGTAALSPSEDGALRAAAEVYRDSKGAARIGIIGHSNSRRLDVSAVANRESNRSLAAERAAAVARALEKLGVPAGKIYAGATGETAGDYVEVFAAY